MNNFKYFYVRDTPIFIKRSYRRYPKSDRYINKDWYKDADNEPSKISFIGKQFFLFCLKVYLRNKCPYSWLQVIIDILVIEAEIDYEGNSKKRVIEQIIGLCVVITSRKCTFHQIEKYYKSNDYIFPTEENEKIWISIVKPPSMMQYKPI